MDCCLSWGVEGLEGRVGGGLGPKVSGLQRVKADTSSLGLGFRILASRV